MRTSRIFFRTSLITATVLSAGSLAACSHPAQYNDAVYNDRHRWDRREEAAYRRWEEQRRLNHIEYERRNVEEQRAYWTWRHSNPG